MHLRPNAELSIRKIDNEIFIYDRNRSLIHTFNETGALLWDSFVQGIEKAAMTRRLIDEYDIDESTASEDIESFFESISSLGLAVSVP